MRVALLQLPVQSHDYGYSLENIPLAAGYLKGYAEQALGPDVHIEICPEDEASLAGDAAVLDWIEACQPRMVGFSCYLWNIERSLHLCRKVRERLPQARIVLGGPEVSPDNGLLAQAPFDAAVHGEGEETFRDLLAWWGAGEDGTPMIPGLIVPVGGRPVSLGKRPPIARLDGIPSPYLGGCVNKAYTGTIFLETVRGCVYRCSYCCYRKQFGGLRCFDLERTGAEVRWAAQAGADEISFLDPCFARRPRIEELLAVLKDAGRRRAMKMSCELNAEDLSIQLVDRLVRAGVWQMEVGLQSTNPKALAMCGRVFDERKFIRGVGLLLSSGVHVTTDIMVGLPGDTLDDVRRSIDFVVDHGLYSTLNLYPVSVLPDTRLRSRAAGMGVAYQGTPPYYVIRTRDMGPDDIRSAFDYASARTGRNFFPAELPRVLSGPPQGRQAGFLINLAFDPQAGDAGVDPGRIGQALTLEVRDPDWLLKRGSLREKLLPILEENPYTLISWIVPEEYARFPDAVECIKSISLRDDHPCDREFMSTGSSLCSTRLFIRSRLKGPGYAYTHIPLGKESGRLHAFLPEETGSEDEGYLAERIGRLIGRNAEVDFSDIPVYPAVPDGRLGSTGLRI